MPALRDKSTFKVIRLAYHGCTNRPFFHIVVLPNRKPRNSKPLEVLGTYDPMPNIYNERLVSLSLDRFRHWYIQNEAKLSKPVQRILGLTGMLPLHPSTKLAAHRMAQQNAQPQPETAGVTATAESS